MKCNFSTFSRHINHFNWTYPWFLISYYLKQGSSTCITQATCSPLPNLKIFFLCLLMLTVKKNTIKTTDINHWSSVFRRFQVQVPCLCHASIWTIPLPYHPHPASSEHVWHYISLWIVVLQDKVYQAITCLMRSSKTRKIRDSNHSYFI